MTATLTGAGSGIEIGRHIDPCTGVEIRSCPGPEGARLVVWVESRRADSTPGAPTLSASACAEATAAAAVAHAQGLPLVLEWANRGADVDEGVAALDAWGRLCRATAGCSGVVPVIMIVDGPVQSGSALLVGLADIVVMTEASHGYINGPARVADFTGVSISGADLGRAAVLARETGVASMVVTDFESAVDAVLDVLSYLPASVDHDAPVWPSDDPVDRPCPELSRVLPDSPTGSYDMRHIVEAIADVDSVLELRAAWAPNVVTALARIDGRPVGVVANQPLALAGTLDIPASQKAARFVAFCDAFDVALLTLVDTPGFYPGKDLEWRGMIRHGAQLVFAYGRATVPRVCVIVRKSYGGAYIVMDSKRMGNDVCVAWPGAELAVMGAGQAAAILARRSSPEERAAFEADYADRLLNPYVAAERGYVDAVIDPADTRRVVADAFAALADKREVLSPRKHGNEPL